MKTTVEIADQTYVELEMKALQEGSTVRALIHRAVDIFLRNSPPLPRKNTSSAFPVIKSKHPGSQKIDNDLIFDGIEFP